MAKVAIEDLSGHTTPVTGNPYDGLISATNNNSKQLQERYDLHRRTRNEQQKAKIVDENFPGWVLDEYLVKLDGPRRDPSFVDPRNCLVFWARPPQKVRNLVNVIQQKLQDVAPDLWLMPLDSLHMTAMEVTHSLTTEEIEHLVSILLPNVDAIVDLPYHHRARLIKPMVSYDSAALALSFVPASGEAVPGDRRASEDEYTYHHLRRDLYTAIENAGVKVASRYVVPSAHLTIARFNTPNVFGGDPMDKAPTLELKKRSRWIREIEMINDWLEAIMRGGEWIVGEERGIDFRKGRLWYGGGETIKLGTSFAHR
ncbi:hypothetical protein EPUS_00987 [Endocarpon pusillum Z07020]|uniref:RNA ligase/cyclic nucleotide phosphodiesterase n=1 Tax=Endocarpon pusillum (strain Z07020 / HMAS-L-300199) TaxID=1263415 RepID=U1GN82_ENDPU|nr:uncharacterized protein EPUS_00987 [Endocarpon pusillum Z07020]ERF73733.1 hypothetical protein EPUS_00987 [Endocarpon pusillum Z07020]